MTRTRTLKTECTHPTDGTIIVISTSAPDGTQIGPIIYRKFDPYHTPWGVNPGENPSELICGGNVYAEPVVSAPADQCLSTAADDLVLTFVLDSDGGAPAELVSESISVSPDVSVEEWFASDDVARTATFGSSLATPGEYVVTYLATTPGGAAAASATVTIVDPATIGPAPASHNFQPGETVAIDVPHSGLAGPPVVAGLPSWLSSFSLGTLVRFLGEVPAGEPPATHAVTVNGSNCDGAATEFGFDVVVNAPAQCAPAVGYDVGSGNNDIFTGGNALGESGCGSVDTTDPSYATLQAMPVAWASTKRNNNSLDLQSNAIVVPDDGCAYAANILMMETFATGPGGRVFDILVNGVVRAADVDIYAAVGAQCKAYVVQVPLGTGSNVISFTNKVNTAVVYGAEVVCLGCQATVSAPADVTLVQGQALSGVTAIYTGVSPTVTVSGEPGWVTATDDAAGTVTFTGTAPAANSGPTTITVTADDGVNPPAVDTFDLTVIDPATDNPPVVTAPANITVPAGQSVTGSPTFSVTDDGQSTQTVTKSITPPGSSLDVSTVAPHVVSGSTTVGEEGNVYTVELTAADGVAPGGVSDSMTVTVSAPVTTTPTGNFAATPGFDANVHLSAAMRGHWTNFWAAYDEQKVKGGVTWTRGGNFYQDPMEEMLAYPPVNASDSLGSYSMARAWTFGLYGLASCLFYTGDPRVLTEVYAWAQQFRIHLQDHDGRGYPYIRYANPGWTENQWGVDNDLNWLEECMLGAVISLMAHLLHVNRGIDSAWGAEADFWFTYLDTNLVPKWLYRTHFASINNGPRGASPVFTQQMAADLGLSNALGWDSNLQPPGRDDQLWANPWNNSWGSHPMRHPLRQYAHSGLMNGGMHYLLGKWCADTGYTPVGNWDGTGAEYDQQAIDVASWFEDQCRDNADGSRDWFINMNNGTNNATGAHGATGGGGLISNGYSLHPIWWSWFFSSVVEGFGHFADDNNMIRYRKQWWNEGSDNGVWRVGDLNAGTPSQYHFNDASGGKTGMSVRSVALWTPWDSTGEVVQRINWAVDTAGPAKHKIGDRRTVNGSKVPVIHSTWNDPIHYCGLMADEAGL